MIYLCYSYNSYQATLFPLSMCVCAAPVIGLSWGTGASRHSSNQMIYTVLYSLSVCGCAAPVIGLSWGTGASRHNSHQTIQQTVTDHTSPSISMFDNETLSLPKRNILFCDRIMNKRPFDSDGPFFVSFRSNYD